MSDSTASSGSAEAASTPEDLKYAKADLSYEPEEQDLVKRKRDELATSDSADSSPNKVEKQDFKKIRSEDYLGGPSGGSSVESESNSAAAHKPVDTTNYSDMSIKTEIMEIAQEKVGQIIGSKGAIIQDLQSKTGCKIQVNQDFPPGAPRQVVYTGSALQIKTAKDLVALIMERGPTAIHMLNGPIITQVVECPQVLVGRVIGAGGSTIRDIQARCAVKIQVHQDMPDGVPRRIEIVGNGQAVSLAAIAVRQVRDGSAGPPMGGPGGMMMPLSMGAPSHMGMMGASYGGQHVIECAKQYVGRLIGRAGETINLLQSKSGARVQIDQKVGYNNIKYKYI